MKWPSPQEYNEAIQNPKLNFKDLELQQFKPQLNQFGMPVPNTGAFATVYRLSNSGRNFAVRCFLNHYPDQEERYGFISKHLETQQLGCIVPFEFQKEGIRVNGTWYPILKMEWISGERIDVFIYKNLNNPSVLADMSEKWLTMINSLKAAGIAHGDLQHGNILISSGQIKLIDYDGMFVPQLSGRQTHEIGHRNYQHPLRKNSDYGATLDNFSSWVIYASLLGFSIDKMLWAYAKAGDESLLFSDGDYRKPDQSATIALLKKHPSEKLRCMTEEVYKFPALPVLGLPSLEDGIRKISASAAAKTLVSSVAGRANIAASNKCPRCGRGLREKKVPGTFISYWQCEDAPVCNYRKNDGDDVAPIVVPVAAATFNAAQAAASGLVFLDPSATGSPCGGIASQQTGGSGSGYGARPGSAATNQGSYARSKKPSSARVRRSSAVTGINANTGPASYSGTSTTAGTATGTASAVPCPYCGAATTVTNTASPQRICFNFPTCLYTEKC